ncbi:MAG: 4-alpha-glucanotransferase [Spirochaetaceae bacterium]|nr:4-alpha-glucanotransferase [Spirochaetaceae bacterium]
MELKDIDFNKRRIGVVAPLGSLRTEKSIGIGEFPDLPEFAKFCEKGNIGLIQLLPVNDTGAWSSPYFAMSAFALHPIYLRISDIPEAKGNAGYQKGLDSLALQFNKLTRYPFEKIYRAKLALLRQIFADNKAEILASASGASGKLSKWIKKNPWVSHYAVYHRLKDSYEEKSWEEWPENKNLSIDKIEKMFNDKALKEEHLFYVWVQEACDAQFSAAAKAVRDKGIILEGDLPILINEDSCDVWTYRKYFNLDLSAGAPPDMYSPEGQNWGFPLYNWDVLAKNDYDFWKDRLKVAENYYSAYRIDHVLGFFRIWATTRSNTSSALGRFIPYKPIKRKELEDIGWNSARIRWVSQPHIPSSEVPDGNIFAAAFNRIGNEELWLFKDSIKGDKDIDKLDLPDSSKAFLKQAWHNRFLIEYEKGLFTPYWSYKESRAWASLSDGEKKDMEALIEKHEADSEKTWETGGKKILSVLREASAMLPCAEDLGAVPDCVPRVLTKLKILGLRVVRWYREWDKNDQPYIPLEEYPELSVCTPAVHDCSTLRQWWETEADQEQFAKFLGAPALPKVYNPGAAKTILMHLAASASRYRVFQIQDLLHLSAKWYASDPAEERINVPGTLNDFNWTYRLPATIADIAQDEALVDAVKELASVKPEIRKSAAS